MDGTKNAFYVKSMTDWKSQAAMYNVQPPIEWDSWEDDGNGEYVTVTHSTKYVVVSASDYVSPEETYIFACDEYGKVTNFLELDGSMRGVYDHKAALNAAGYYVEPRR